MNNGFFANARVRLNDHFPAAGLEVLADDQQEAKRFERFCSAYHESHPIHRLEIPTWQSEIAVQTCTLDGDRDRLCWTQAVYFYVPHIDRLITGGIFAFQHLQSGMIESSLVLGELGAEPSPCDENTREFLRSLCLGLGVSSEQDNVFLHAIANWAQMPRVDDH